MNSLALLYCLLQLVSARHLSPPPLPTQQQHDKAITQHQRSSINGQSIVLTSSGKLEDSGIAEKCKINEDGGNCVPNKHSMSLANGGAIHEGTTAEASYQFNPATTETERNIDLPAVVNKGIRLGKSLDKLSQLSSESAGLSGLNALMRAGRARKMGYDVPHSEKYLELAVFLGDPAYRLLRSGTFKFSDKEIVALILSYVNQIQAVFYQPSLRGKLHITVTHVELHRTPRFDTFGGDRDLLLNSFCEYQAALNSDGTDPELRHWDMALYLTSLNFFAAEAGGSRNYVSMGLAPLGGVCVRNNNCVIAEFGTVNDMGHPYPSAGLMSAWVAAHEMAHNLGVFHDGQQMNECPGNGYLMSSSRGTRGEVTWSLCSAQMFSLVNASCLNDVPANTMYDHRVYNLRPGQTWDANDQCKLFLQDSDAFLFNTSLYKTICDMAILCKSPNKIGYFSAGPALEGTFCGQGNTCQHGQCLPETKARPMPVVRGGWSTWKTVTRCESGCITNGTGAAVKRRSCDNPKPRNTVEYCEGDAIRAKLCDDTALCGRKRRLSPNDYAQQQCHRFASYVGEIETDAEGLQIAHEPDRDWRACAIFCRLRTGMWYTPRYELNDMQDQLNPFFPDGTWCHHDRELGDFYCQHHRCLPVKSSQVLVGRSGETEETIFMDQLNLTNAVDVIRLRSYSFYDGISI